MNDEEASAPFLEMERFSGASFCHSATNRSDFATTWNAFKGRKKTPAQEHGADTKEPMDAPRDLLHRRLILQAKKIIYI